MKTSPRKSFLASLFPSSVAITFLVFGLVLSATLAEALPKLTNDEIYETLSARLARVLDNDRFNTDIGERGRFYAWYWGYIGRALLEMHEVTGEQRFLDLFTDTSWQLIDLRDDALGLVDPERERVVPSWGTLYKNGIRANEITTAGFISLPMCQYAVKTGDEMIGQKAVETLGSFIDEREEAFGGYYFQHRSEGYVEPINHAHVYGAALAYCSELSYAPSNFEETALGIYRYWRHFVRQNGEGISWPYMPTPTSAQNLPSEAIWKAAVSIELPVALAAVGLIDGSEIIPKIAKTITRNPIVIKGGIPQFFGNDRSEDMIGNRKFEGSSLAGLAGAFVLLKEDEVDDLLIEWVNTHSELFPGGWEGGSRTMPMAYAYLLNRGRLKNEIFKD